MGETMIKKLFFFLTVFAFVTVSSHTVDAGVFDKVKKGVKKGVKKVEHKLGWDRYILCWGDRFVPPEDRWVAIRSGVKKKKHDIGRFWDVPGKGKQVEGPGKEVKLWDITFQEYPKADRRYKFLSVYDRTHHPDDYGYYVIKAKTGMYVQAGKKGQTLRLNKGYNLKDRNARDAESYQWLVKNVGKNRFVFVSRKNGLAIDAKGGKAKKGDPVALWNDKGQRAVQWEFIYIAQGKEVKSTKTMAKKRAKEVRKMTKQVANQFEQIAKNVSKKVTAKAKAGLYKLDDKLLSVKKKGQTYELSVGLPQQNNLVDELKEKTIDKLFKMDFKKIKFEPSGKDKIVVGLINRIECMGHHVDLSVEMKGDWSIDKNGFTVKNFKMHRFSLPFLPDSLTKDIRKAISKETKKLNIHINNFPGKALIADSGSHGPMKVSNFHKGPYGFQVALTPNRAVAN